MNEDIQRIGAGRRWSDVVIHQGVARFVEVAENPLEDMTGQTRQVLSQMDATLSQIGSDKTRVLQVLVYVNDLADVGLMNKEWDDWAPAGHAPVRACVQAGLAPGYRIEIVVTAAIAQ